MGVQVLLLGDCIESHQIPLQEYFNVSRTLDK